MKNKGWSNTNLYYENDNPEYWIDLLKPGLIKQFNDKNIILTDTSTFKQDC